VSAFFVERSTYRVYDIFKPSVDSRNFVVPGGVASGEPQMSAKEAEAAGWHEAAKCAAAFDRLDGVPS